MKLKYDIDSMIHPDIVGSEREAYKGILSERSSKSLLRVAAAVIELSREHLYPDAAANVRSQEVWIYDVVRQYGNMPSMWCHMATLTGLSIFNVSHLDYTAKKGSSLGVWKNRHALNRTDTQCITKGASAGYVIKRLFMKGSAANSTATELLRSKAIQIQHRLREFMRSYSYTRTETLTYRDTNTNVSVTKLNMLLRVAMGVTSQVSLSSSDREWMTEMHNSFTEVTRKLDKSATSIKAMFACDKWVILSNGTTSDSDRASVVVGAFNGTSVAEEYSKSGEFNRSELGVDIVVPFRAYASLNALPQEIKDALIPTLRMAKVSAPELFNKEAFELLKIKRQERLLWQEQIDPDYLIPSDTNAVSEGMGIFLLDGIYMVDK